MEDGRQYSLLITPETNDEVGEPGTLAHDIVNQRQHRKKLELRHEHERQSRRRPAVADAGGAIPLACLTNGRYSTSLRETKQW